MLGKGREKQAYMEGRSRGLVYQRAAEWNRSLKQQTTKDGNEVKVDFKVQSVWEVVAKGAAFDDRMS